MKLKQNATFGTWLDGSLYERILKDVRIITFEHNVTTRIERISPFIGEWLRAARSFITLAVSCRKRRGPTT